MTASAHIGIFKELLEMSRKQNVCFTDGKLDEAVEIIKVREALIEELKADGVRLSLDDTEAKGIIKQIVDSDEHLTLLLIEKRNSTSENLKRRLKAKKVLNAYSSTISTVD